MSNLSEPQRERLRAREGSVSANLTVDSERAPAESTPEKSNENILSAPLLSNSRQDDSRDYLRMRVTRFSDPDEAAAASVDDSRILDRNRAFRQSRGRWSVRRVSRLPQNHNRCHNFCWCCYRGRIWKEWNLGGWFHRLAYQRTGILMFILAFVYSLIVFFFAAVYLTVSYLGQTVETNPDGTEKITPFCHMDINNKLEALYLSMSTMASIGYGISNYFVGDCWTPFGLVLFQVCCAILFDAVAVGLLFHRISRGRKRSRTIAFSDKAVIRRVQGIPYLMFRVGELRRYFLISAAIRCYCVRHIRIPKRKSGFKRDDETGVPLETTHYVSRQMKLLNPNENGGSDIWMGLPQVIVHRMDEESPLVPNGIWYDVNGYPQTPSHISQIAIQSNMEDPLSSNSALNDLDDIAAFLLDRDVEIVVLVEGIDEGTGAATQARHSYKVTDLAWNHKFLPCVFPYTDDGNQQQANNRSGRHPVCSIDFSRFHDIAPAPDDCEACPYVSQNL